MQFDNAIIHNSVQLRHSVLSDSATPWTAARQTSLSITNSQSLPKLMSIESVMPSNHLLLCVPFSSSLQSFPASGSFQMSQLFTSGGQSIGQLYAYNWRRKWQPTPVLLSGKSHGQRSMVDHSPWGRKESDTTEQLHFISLQMHII